MLATPDRKSTRLNSALSVSDALPLYDIISSLHRRPPGFLWAVANIGLENFQIWGMIFRHAGNSRSEEHTSELQSLPTRRSSDLRHYFKPSSPAAGFFVGGGKHRTGKFSNLGHDISSCWQLQIGRAHV